MLESGFASESESKSESRSGSSKYDSGSLWKGVSACSQILVSSLISSSAVRSGS